MSLKHINHKETIQSVDAFGVTWWENPIIDLTINSLGAVHKNDLTHKKLEGSAEKGKQPKFSGRVDAPEGVVHANGSFNAIYARMVLGVRLLPAYIIVLKNKSKGYIPDNVVIRVAPRPNRSKHYTKSLVARQEKLALQPQVPETTSEVYYTHHLAVESHTTEDGAVFHNKDEAVEHQRYVAKGKSNAQVVLDHVTDYNLAEQIYFQEVKYSGKVPYLNFRDVMNDNAGMVYSVKKEHAVFDKIPPTILQWIQSEDIYDFRALEMSLKQAELVQEKLEQVLLKRASFVSAVLDLKTNLIGRFNAK